VALLRVAFLGAAAHSEAWATRHHRPQGLGHEQCERYMHDQETDDHRHSGEMQHPRGLEAAEQRNQAGELDRLPDGEAGDDLGDAGEDDDDVE
jgi:hypothetical protein